MSQFDIFFIEAILAFSPHLPLIVIDSLGKNQNRTLGDSRNGMRLNHTRLVLEKKQITGGHEF